MEIADALEGEGITVSKSGEWKLLKRYKETGNTERRPGSGRQSINTDEIKKIIDDTMEKDDETTISQSATILQESGHTISNQKQQYLDVDGNWAGHFAGAPTAS